MTTSSADYLYQLLPAVYRIRDAENGEPLRALLGVIGSELDVIQSDIAGLYDNWFIETCDEWVVPYIGDLLGVRPIRPVPTAGVSTRAYVANTLAYRRRKGTVFVLERLARDTTGWPARAVEFFQRLATTQHMNHARPQCQVTPSIRNAARAELADTAFDEFAHLPEMRRAATRGGRYNVPNVGLFLWRIQSYPLDRVTARRLPGAPNPNTFACHPAGVPTPLFNRGTVDAGSAHLGGEADVPGRLRRLALHEEFETARGTASTPLRFMNADQPALRIFVERAGAGRLDEVPVAGMYVCDIPDSLELLSPAPLAVAVDPVRGQLRFPAGLDIARVLVSFNYGCPGDIGGGPYDRRDSERLAPFTGEGCEWQAGVSHTGETANAPAQIFSTLAAAIAAWNGTPPGTTGVIVVMDSETDGVPVTAASPSVTLDVVMKEGARLLIIAASWPEQAFVRPFGSMVPDGLRPHVIADLVVHGVAPVESTEPGALTINGLLLEGTLTVADGHLGALSVQHSTLVAPRVSLPSPAALAPIRVAAGNDRLQLALERSVAGSVELHTPIRDLSIRDSIVAAGIGSPSIAVSAPTSPCSFESSTFEGTVTAETLSASNCLFTDQVWAIRRQTGCLRFSYVPPGSSTPRRYRCQPELAIGLELGDAVRTPLEVQAIRDRVSARVRPLFVSLAYGDAECGQLDARCPAELRTGAEDGSEMGAYRLLQQPHREANLRTVLQEYLRFGLEAGLFYVT